MSYMVAHCLKPEHLMPLSPTICATKPRISYRGGWHVELWRDGEYMYRYGSWDECLQRAWAFLHWQRRSPPA